jgi:CDP-glucose 4,6-dehydratase
VEGVAVNSFWENRNVLVTGMEGFLASWLCKALVEAKANVIGIDIDRNPHSNFYRLGLDKHVTLTHGSVTDFHTVERVMNEHEVDTCFHLGAQAIVSIANRSPLSTFNSNIQGTWNVLEAARRSQSVGRVVVASSDKAYGSHKNLPYSEDTPLHGLHPYDASKSCADLLAQTYFNTYGLPVCVSRCGNFYGGGDLNFSRIIPGTIRSLIRNERPVIRSDGSFTRDYIYIDDIVAAYLALAEQLERRNIVGQAFNFGNNSPLSVLEVVDRIIEVSGKKQLQPVILNAVKNEIDNQTLLSKKATDLLGWKAKWAFEDGVRETYSWYSQFFKVGSNEGNPSKAP